MGWWPRTHKIPPCAFAGIVRLLPGWSDCRLLSRSWKLWRNPSFVIVFWSWHFPRSRRSLREYEDSAGWLYPGSKPPSMRWKGLICERHDHFATGNCNEGDRVLCTTVKENLGVRGHQTCHSRWYHVRRQDAFVIYYHTGLINVCIQLQTSQKQGVQYVPWVQLSIHWIINYQYYLCRELTCRNEGDVF